MKTIKITAEEEKILKCALLLHKKELWNIANANINNNMYQVNIRLIDNINVIFDKLKGCKND